jgi:hypothetical protein
LVAATADHLQGGFVGISLADFLRVRLMCTARLAWLARSKTVNMISIRQASSFRGQAILSL